MSAPAPGGSATRCDPQPVAPTRGVSARVRLLAARAPRPRRTRDAPTRTEGSRGDVPEAHTSHRPGRATHASYRRVGSPGAATGAQRAGTESRRLFFPELLRACAERVGSDRSSIAGRRPPPSSRRPAATSQRLNDCRPRAALPRRPRRTGEPGSAARQRRGDLREL